MIDMDKTEVQLFDNDYKQRCDTFSCGEPSRYFVGRPDAPLSTAMNLCQKCTDQLVESIVEMFGLHEKSVHANTPPPTDNDSSGEVTLEEILASVRSHVELDAVAAELGIEGLPSRDEKKLDERKKYVLDYDFPDGE